MFRKFSSMIILLCSIQMVHSQDEIFLKKIIIGQSSQQAEDYIQIFEAWGDQYQVDLNQDGKSEFLQYGFVDGKIHVRIFSSDKKPLFSSALQTFAGKAEIPYLRLTRLSTKEFLMAIVLRDGVLEFKQFQNNARLYFLSFQTNLESFHLQKGPTLFIENEKWERARTQRLSQFEFVDTNKDGVKEVLVYTNGIRRVYPIERP